MPDPTTRIAVVGVGNCASALVQGLASGASGPISWSTGGPLRPIEVVAAFDVDRRKVGRHLGEAIFAPPNCAVVFHGDVPPGPRVRMGPVLDGVAEHMSREPEARSFRVADLEPVDVTAELRASGAQVLVCFVPVGAERAARHYAEACLAAGVAMVNCVPVFLASDPEIASRFEAAGLPLLGDDVKSQFGATMLHRALVRALADRGVGIERTYQLNTGGNTDFLNMLDRSRLRSKSTSKTEAVQSQLDRALDAADIHIGPSDYVPWQRDNKVCFLRIEARGFGGQPIELEARLSVQDSPNAAAVVIEAVHCARLALERGLSGALPGPSALLMKRPPLQMREEEALRRTSGELGQR